MLSVLQHRHWALDEAYFERISAIIVSRLRHGHTIEGLIEKKTIEDRLPLIQSMLAIPEGHPDVIESQQDFKMVLDQASGLPLVQCQNGNVAVIPVVGALTKYGDLCNYGMQDYQRMLSAANASPNVDAIVMIIDSPGGTVDGTPEFGLAVKNSSKPVGVFGDSLVGSAAMWVASQAVVIVGNKNNPTQFGSIGTLMIKQDFSKMQEMGQIQMVEIIRAPQSTDKALVNSFEPIPDGARTELMSQLRDITNQFIDTVKKGRGEALNADTPGLFTGKTFDVYASKKAGLIDSVGTLQTAVNKVLDVAATRKKMASNQSTNTNMNILQFLGLSKEQKAQLSSEDQAKLDQLEAKYTGQEQQISALETEKGALAAKLSEKETELTAAKAKVEELQKKLDEKPAGHATTVVGAQDPGKENEEQKKKFHTSVDDEAASARAQMKALNPETV